MQSIQPWPAMMRRITLSKRTSGYLPFHRRVASPPPMRLTKRDPKIILAVYYYRLLSSPQIEALFFPSQPGKSHSRRSACQRRLQLLFHHSYLDRLFIPLVIGQGRTPFIYTLGTKGAALLATKLGVDAGTIRRQPKANKKGSLFLEHTLAVNDVRVMGDCLARTSQWQLTDWLDDSIFRQETYREKVPFRNQGIKVRRHFPDGYFVLQPADGVKKAHFFLEMDLGTMSNARWREKVEAYIQFRKSGRAAQHYGTNKFRLLTVTTSDRRLKNLKRTTEKAGGTHYFWFTTQAHIDIEQPENLLNPIWSVSTKKDKLALF